MSAMYFKGNWSNKFDKSETRNRSFYFDDQHKIPVPTMSITAQFLNGDLEEEDAQFVVIPYSVINLMINLFEIKKLYFST